MSVPPTSPSTPASGETKASEGGFNLQRSLRDFYLAQIEKARQSVSVSKARMEALRSALEAANDALTEISTLQIKVPEGKSSRDFNDYIKGNKEEFKRVQFALANYQIVIGTLLYPAPGTAGTSSRIQDGKERSYYAPPFTGVRWPDFSHLGSILQSSVVEKVPENQMWPVLGGMIRLRQAGGPATLSLFDESTHNGASISKTVKILQAEIQALNQAFQMESSDATSALSTENSIREGSKSAMDKCYRVLGESLGLRV
ncbi:MAG: hypothetical protein RL522_694 [Pseudomonadota bacterium]|jgi:hypothetical protein